MPSIFDMNPPDRCVKLTVTKSPPSPQFLMIFVSIVPRDFGQVFALRLTMGTTVPRSAVLPVIMLPETDAMVPTTPLAARLRTPPIPKRPFFAAGAGEPEAVSAPVLTPVSAAGFATLSARALEAAAVSGLSLPRPSRPNWAFEVVGAATHATAAMKNNVRDVIDCELESSCRKTRPRRESLIHARCHERILMCDRVNAAQRRVGASPDPGTIAGGTSGSRILVKALGAHGWPWFPSSHAAIISRHVSQNTSC
ncbi:MAG: hypothetical protein H7305_16365 [Gemmatimonadaceae bacterium]|nr:hypothetical protein [Gemmatimonadaceae bacterium]